MRTIHIVETLDVGGGGIPRVARIVEHFFPNDLIVPVLDLSFFSVFSVLFSDARRRTRGGVLFLHNIYCLRAVFFALVASFVLGVHLVVTPHGATNRTFVSVSLKKRVYLWLFLKFVSKRVSLFHYLNEFELKDSYLRAEVEGKSSVFSFPVLLEGDVPLRSGKLVVDRELRVVFFSRVEERKGIYVLLEAVGRLRESGLDVVLDVFGNLEDRKFLDVIGGKGYVRFHGVVQQSEYLKRSSQYDVFCLPSFGEAHSLSLYENILIGVPCVVSKQSNPPCVDGVVVYGDAQDSDGLATCLRNCLDSGFVFHATSANLDFGRTYNIGAVEKIREVIAEIGLVDKVASR